MLEDIRHIGSTSIRSIKAKPIIDIAIAVDNFEDVLRFEKELKTHGFYYRPQADSDEELLFASGSYYDGTGDLQTHFIHVVKTESLNWSNYVNFSNYLNCTPSIAKEYETLKVSLAAQTPAGNKREEYTKGKHDFIVYALRKALVYSYLGKTVGIVIDRPIGSVHPKHEDLVYPINYGFIPGVYCGDGKELDVYLMGLTVPVKECNAKIIAVVHRHNDVEDKLVASPGNMRFTKNEIEAAVRFQEQYFESEIEVL